MSESLAGFLRRAKEDAEDDTPRLILADWLEEQDNPRGEFVRLQVQRAALGRHPPGRRCLLKREILLLEEHGQSWVTPMHTLTREPGHKPRLGSTNVFRDVAQMLAGPAGATLEEIGLHILTCLAIASVMPGCWPWRGRVICGRKPGSTWNTIASPAGEPWLCGTAWAIAFTLPEPAGARWVVGLSTARWGRCAIAASPEPSRWPGR